MITMGKQKEKESVEKSNYSVKHFMRYLSNVHYTYTILSLKERCFATYWIALKKEKKRKKKEKGKKITGNVYFISIPC